MSLTATYHLAQACLCGYTVFLSYTAIMKLLQYEEKTEKAAQYSSVAAEQLHRTRTTQAGGAVAVRLFFGLGPAIRFLLRFVQAWLIVNQTLSSLCCSLYLVVSPPDQTKIA